MFSGDETGGVVVDAGNSTCKFGYAGDDFPKAVFPGYFGILREEGDANKFYVGNSTKLFRPRVDVRPLLDYGIVEDWDAMETVWTHGFREIKCDVSERPVILSEPAYSITSQRERTAEIMFETFGVPALFLARQPLLAALSVGRASAIVVDIGYTATRVAPVYDGYVIQKGMHMSDVGASLLTQALQDALLKEKVVDEVLPRHAFTKTVASSIGHVSSHAPSAEASASNSMDVENSPSASSSASAAAASAAAGAAASSSISSSSLSSSSSSLAATLPQSLSTYFTGNNNRWSVTRRELVGETRSFRQYTVFDVWDDMKKSVCEVHETGYDPAKPPPTVTYELPDGNTVKIRNSQQLIPELHFRPDLTDNVRHLLAHRQTPAWIMQYQSQSITMRHSVQLANGSTVSVPVPLPTMIHNALLNCTPEVRREMCNHVVLTGGGSLLKGLQQRLHWELLAVIPTAFKPRVVTPAPLEREFANWIGGSILSVLGTFQQMWVSKAEYDEEGPTVIDRKCT